jgi:hypothetical protein
MLIIVSVLLVLAGILFSTIFIRQEQMELAHQASPDLIQMENARPGTAGWRVTKQASNQIQAYTEEPSINTGEVVDLYLSTSSPSFSIDIYRLGYYQGIGARLVKSIPSNTGIYQGYYLYEAANAVDCKTCITSLVDSQGRETDITDANWQYPVSIEFPSDWISGIYYIKLTESKSGYQWAVPLVLRDDARNADLIFEDPVNTDQAYNFWGGTGLYDDFRHPGKRNGFQSKAYYVSFARPYRNGYGVGNLFDWTYSMLQFIEKNGYDVTYTTNDAVSGGLTNLTNYKGFVVGGHDEYWDYSERQKVEQAISKGMSLASFSANVMYWQIRYTTVPNTNHKAIICYKYPKLDPYSTKKNLQYLTTTTWREPPVNDPEDKVLKAMFVSLNAYKVQDFVAKNTNSWVYDGTNMKDGDIIKKVLGREVDTMFSDGSITSNDRITIIGESPYIDQYGKHVVARAVLDEPVTGKNIIFDASSYVWPDALSDFPVTWNDGPVPESSVLERITNNILQRIVHGSPPS